MRKCVLRCVRRGALPPLAAAETFAAAYSKPFKNQCFFCMKNENLL
jgi:hypothetical protein